MINDMLLIAHGVTDETSWSDVVRGAAEVVLDVAFKVE